MPTLSDFPFFPVHVDRDAAPVDPAEEEALLAHLAAHAPSDVLVLAHGWNNDLAEARALYERLLASLRDLVDEGHAPGVSPQTPVVGFFWPSKKFASAELVAGGAASAGADASTALLQDRLRDLAETLGPDATAHLDGAAALVPLLDERAFQDRFVAELLAVLPPDGSDAFEDGPAPPRLRTAAGHEIIAQLAQPLLPPAPAAGQGGATSIGSAAPARDVPGGAAGLGDMLRGARAAALRLANFTTYYVMKQRAGIIGRDALAPLLDRIAGAAPGVRVHLVGHSFGGRLVTAAASAVEQPVQSLVLLQAAFSHHGLAEAFDGTRDGAFRGVLTGAKVRGPVLITHTDADHAVGYAYPVASRLAGQTASGLGDAADPYGGIGRNGAQKTPDARSERLLPVGGTYTLVSGGVHNLLADGFVTDHSDVHGREVAGALAAAIAHGVQST